RIEASTHSGRGVPSRSMTAWPACWMSQLMRTPLASSTERVAATISGPMPSPGMHVTPYVDMGSAHSTEYGCSRRTALLRIAAASRTLLPNVRLLHTICHVNPGPSFHRNDDSLEQPQLLE